MALPIDPLNNNLLNFIPQSKLIQTCPEGKRMIWNQIMLSKYAQGCLIREYLRQERHLYETPSSVVFDQPFYEQPTATLQISFFLCYIFTIFALEILLCNNVHPLLPQNLSHTLLFIILFSWFFFIQTDLSYIIFAICVILFLPLIYPLFLSLVIKLLSKLCEEGMMYHNKIMLYESYNMIYMLQLSQG